MVNPPDVEPTTIRIYPTGDGSVKIHMPKGASDKPT